MVLKSVSLAATAVMALSVSVSAEARTQMRAVGSSTVYPFAKIVAERIARANPRLGTPIIESTGTGAGMKLFCAGVGERFPDVENASRRMKASEAKLCAVERRHPGHRDPGRHRRHQLRDREEQPAAEPHPARPLPGARQDSVRAAQSRQDLARRQRQPAQHSDPGLRPAADIGHARRVGRADPHAAVRGQSLDGRAQEERREPSSRRSAPGFAKTAATSKRAKTTI